MVIMMKKEFTKLGKKGLDKYTSLYSSKSMMAYNKKYEDSGYKYSDLRKNHFYEFVARNRLRKKRIGDK